MIQKMIYGITERRNEMETNTLKLTDEGYVYISKNGIEYELLDGVTINPKGQSKTSDICFIMFVYVQHNDDDPKETNSTLIDWFWGSAFVGQKYINGEFIESLEADGTIVDAVDNYEKAHPDFVKMYGKEN